HWPATISAVLKLDACMTTPSTDRPSASSYDITCAVARTPPSIEYLLFEAQPAIAMPYTPIDVTASRYRMPTLNSASCKKLLPPAGAQPPGGTTPSPPEGQQASGMVAQMISAGITAKAGEIRYTHLSAIAGVISSLKNSLTASAAGCRKPPSSLRPPGSGI